MSMALVVLLGILAVAVVIGIAVLQAKRAKSRREAFAAGAAARGWGYSAEDPRWVDYFADAPFGVGHRRSAKNVLTGTVNSRDFVAFDYRYYTTETSSNGKTTTTREVAHPYAVVAVQTGVVFPELSVVPEGIFSRMIGRLTGHDIELESEDFNRAFTVHCPDRKFASDVLNPQQMEFLLTRPQFAFRFSGPWVLTIDTGAFEPMEIDLRLNYLDAVISHIPDFIWKDVQN